MLVLSRKSSETIVVNEQIKIHVLQIRRGSIRIGIEAPGEVSIRRGELTPTSRMERELTTSTTARGTSVLTMRPPRSASA